MAQLRAFHNVCRHRAYRLLDGRFRPLRVQLVTLPLIMAGPMIFTGMLIGVPSGDDRFEGFDRAKFGLTAHRDGHLPGADLHPLRLPGGRSLVGRA